MEANSKSIPSSPPFVTTRAGEEEDEVLFAYFIQLYKYSWAVIE